MKTAEKTFPSVQEVDKIDLLSDPFFQPDDKFVKWLIGYAKGRVIADIGAGSGYLCALIIKHGGKCIGVEPNWTTERKIFWIKKGFDFNVLPEPAEKSMLMTFPAEKVLLVFARPSHGGFLDRTLKARPAGMEALYIGKRENIFIAFGWDTFPNPKFPKLAHKGTSQENEIVISIR
jgi:hypothetical protein